MSKIENAKTDRVLPDDELDAVSGGSSEEPHESCSFNFIVIGPDNDLNVALRR